VCNYKTFLAQRKAKSFSLTKKGGVSIIPQPNSKIYQENLNKFKGLEDAD
jgi:hypothetical protein